MKGRLIQSDSWTTGKGNQIVFTVWSVPKSIYYPDCIKLSYALLSNDERVLGIDNHNNEPLHIHYGNKKEYVFGMTLHKIKRKFFELVEEYESKQPDNIY